MTHHGTSTIDIDAGIEELFDIVTDIEAFPTWLDDVQEAEVLEADPAGRPLASRMVVDVTLKVVEYVLEYTYDGNEKMSWVSRPGGDIKHIEGSYAFAMNDDGSTHVTYELAIDPGFPVPGFLLKRAAKHITAQALGGLKERAEAA